MSIQVRIRYLFEHTLIQIPIKANAGSFFQWSRYENQDLMKAVDLLGEIVSAVRHLKKSLNVPRSAKPDVLVITPDPTQLDALVSMASVLAPCGDINLVKDEGDPKSEAVSSFHVMAPLEGSNTTVRKLRLFSSAFVTIFLFSQVFVDLRGHVNVKVEVRRLRDEIEKLETKLAKLSSGKKAGSKSIQGKVQDLNHKKTELLNQLEFLEKYEQLWHFGVCTDSMRMGISNDICHLMQSWCSMYVCYLIFIDCALDDVYIQGVHGLAYLWEKCWPHAMQRK